MAMEFSVENCVCSITIKFYTRTLCISLGLDARISKGECGLVGVSTFTDTATLQTKFKQNKFKMIKTEARVSTLKKIESKEQLIKMISTDIEQLYCYGIDKGNDCLCKMETENYLGKGADRVAFQFNFSVEKFDDFELRVD